MAELRGMEVRNSPAGAEARHDPAAWAAYGTLRFLIDCELSLADAAQARQLIERRATIEKIVLTH